MSDKIIEILSSATDEELKQAVRDIIAEDICNTITAARVVRVARRSRPVKARDAETM